ncbi:MAG: hypothetical protein PHC75_09165 [Burkholderiales bacterium]|nr:hypothetical protein [Burkholderiales bacterium]
MSQVYANNTYTILGIQGDSGGDIPEPIFNTYTINSNNSSNWATPHLLEIPKNKPLVSIISH